MEHSGIISMLRDNKIEDLKRMYNLFGARNWKGFDYGRRKTKRSLGVDTKSTRSQRKIRQDPVRRF